MAEKGFEQSYDKIVKMLPHRYPFLFIDRILEVNQGPDKNERIGRSAKTVKNITFNEPQFQGHFPGFPIMPGVLLIEAMAQTGGIACFQTNDEPSRIMIARVTNARFRRPVVPGDVVTMNAKVIKSKGSMVVIEAQCLVDGDVVAECEFTAHVALEDAAQQ